MSVVLPLVFGSSWLVLLVDAAFLDRMRPRVSKIMSSSASDIWLGAPLARCSANLDLRSSREIGSPEEVRRRVKRRVRLR